MSSPAKREHSKRRDFLALSSALLLLILIAVWVYGQNSSSPRSTLAASNVAAYNQPTASPTAPPSAPAPLLTTLAEALPSASPAPATPPARSIRDDWSVVPGPDLGARHGELRSVAATGADDAWAVGWATENPGNNWNVLYGAPPNGRALIVHWDGQRWEEVPAPVPAVSVLNGVEAISPNDVWVVGQGSDGGTPTPDGPQAYALVLHWDGQSWSNVPLSRDASAPDIINSVSGTASDDVWALGYSTAPSTFDRTTLMLHWDGKQWGSVPLPAPVRLTPTPGSMPHVPYISRYSLAAVLAVSRNEAWAVGTAGDPLNMWYSYPAILRWDGSLWRYSSAHGQDGGWHINLAGIGAYVPGGSQDDWLAHVWAVGGLGSQRPPGGVPPPSSGGVVLHIPAGLDGWQMMDVPCPSGVPQPCGDAGDGSITTDYLYGVAALGPDDVWAVGTRGYTRSFGGWGDVTALFEHWDGSRWTAIPATDLALASDLGAAQEASDLNAITAVPAASDSATRGLWAVGSTGGFNDGKKSPLILRYLDGAYRRAP